MSKFELVVVSGANVGKRFPLEDGSNLIGRWDPEAASYPEVDLEDEDVEAKISRKHAVIVITGHEVAVMDVGSLNGTFVARAGGPEEKLSGETRANISLGDQIIVGKVVLRLEGATS